MGLRRFRLVLPNRLGRNARRNPKPEQIKCQCAQPRPGSKHLEGARQYMGCGKAPRSELPQRATSVDCVLRIGLCRSCCDVTTERPRKARPSSALTTTPPSSVDIDLARKPVLHMLPNDAAYSHAAERQRLANSVPKSG